MALFSLHRLFTRPVAFILAGNKKWPQWKSRYVPTVNVAELAILFCFVFLFLAFAGGGVWSADEQKARRARADRLGVQQRCHSQ